MQSFGNETERNNMTFGERLEYNRKVELKHQELADQMSICIKRKEFNKYNQLAEEYGKYKQISLWDE